MTHGCVDGRVDSWFTGPGASLELDDNGNNQDPLQDTGQGLIEDKPWMVVGALVGYTTVGEGHTKKVWGRKRCKHELGILLLFVVRFARVEVSVELVGQGWCFFWLQSTALGQ